MRRWLAASVLAALLVTGVAAAAQGDQNSLIKPITRPLNIVLVPKVIHPWYDIVHQGAVFAVDEFAKQGITVNLKWDAPPVADLNDHVKRIEANIGVRPDGLAIATLDPEAEARIISDAVEAGINCITFDSDSPNSKRLMYIGNDKSEQDGADLAEYMAKKIGYKGKVGILTGSLTAPTHVGRIKGFKEVMAKYPDIKIVFERPDNDDLQKAVELAENGLQAHPDMVGFFGCNASNPIGIARAVKAAGKVGQICVVGMDDLAETLELIAEGGIDAAMAQRQWEIGYWTVKYLVAMNQNHTYPLEHHIPSRLITKDDL